MIFVAPMIKFFFTPEESRRSGKRKQEIAHKSAVAFQTAI